ncbi:sister chromatid cohesion protein Eso1 [Hypoxylon trugodes]|uniref:sister chromatid cohesion protein Eso1 n=1 Tax=Hypoxylon trugodes TaxID=326681 RepID=UPI00219EA520|nr:sister chromatid cohesion protein Eso1 [Hypoxylon trugodes]KAI1392328.1 sister chromatid cohesion protein Eso1 [Hypoxylon trugodes]
MSSPRFQASSPVHGTGRRKSQFTYRQLGLLSSYSISSPLRVIAHIDLDAFYAQCEMVRLGIADDQPLAVQQWQGLIAVNYPARSFGIGRHCTITDAKKLCPKLISQHVATWKEGDEKWAYHDDAASHIGTHKVSLDPYRLQSRKILAIIKESLPPNMQKVEKASVDEVFVDLSEHVHSILLERFPELANPPPYDDPTEKLPLPPVTALDWQADALVDLEDAEAEVDDPDWDDVAILIGSEIVRDVRAQIRQKLGYTCSAGIAGNKMLSKLGSGHKKPNQQTVIRNRAVQRFLSDMKFTKIRNLGGKLGDEVVSTFHTEAIKDLLLVPVEQMKLKLGDDTGVWLYNTIRGIDSSEVNSRTQIKSMLSAKSFRPSINNQEQAVKWLRIFAADIFSRLVEEGVLENKRRPKTINLHHRQGGQTRSRQSSIPQGRILDEATLFELAKNLLNQIIQEGRVWPCANLSLSVGGFEDGITGNKGIGAFLLKGDEARESRGTYRDSSVGVSTHERPEKKRRVDNPGIQRFFPKKESSSGGDAEAGFEESSNDDNDVADTDKTKIRTVEASPNRIENQPKPITDYMELCTRCDARLEGAEALQSHLDWHLAKDLQDEERGRHTFARHHSTGTRGQKTAAASSSSSKKPARGNSSSSKLEHGQSKLKFG